MYNPALNAKSLEDLARLCLVFCGNPDVEIAWGVSSAEEDLSARAWRQYALSVYPEADKIKKQTRQLIEVREQLDRYVPPTPAHKQHFEVMQTFLANAEKIDPPVPLEFDEWVAGKRQEANRRSSFIEIESAASEANRNWMEQLREAIAASEATTGQPPA